MRKRRKEKYMPLYKEYVAEFRDRFNVKKYSSYHQVDQHKYERIQSVKESYARENKKYNPQKDYDSYLRAVDKNNQLGIDIKKRIEELKNADIQKLRDKEEYKIAADFHHQRSVAGRAMKAKYEPLEKNIAKFINDKGMGGTLNTTDAIDNLKKLYEEHMQYPDAKLSDLAISEKLMYGSATSLNNEFYQELIEKYFKEYKEYRALRETYEEKNADYSEYRKTYEQTERAIKNIKENYSLSHYKNETITTETLSGITKDSSMTLDEAATYCDKQKTRLHESWISKYDDVETYLRMQKEMNAKQNDNKDTIFEELATAKAEARKYNGFMQFLGRYILPGNVFKLGAVMNKVDALTDILKEGGYTQEEIETETEQAGLRVTDQLNEYADHLVRNTMAQNNLILDENAIETEENDSQLDKTEDLDRVQDQELNKQVGDDTNLEKGNVQKSPAVGDNKQLELDNNKEIKAPSNQEMNRPSGN